MGIMGRNGRLDTYLRDEKPQRTATAEHLFYNQNPENYPKETKASVERSKIYTDEIHPRYGSTPGKREVTVLDTDPVSAIFHFDLWQPDKKMALLSFANFNRPGGDFLQGAVDQEALLCLDSNLCNILHDEKFKDFYEENHELTNHYLYADRGLYIPDVAFVRSPVVLPADVISVTFPKKLDLVPEEQNNTAVRSRIRYVLDMAEENGVDLLVLGAFGCGPFGQDPVKVAEAFRDCLMEENYRFEKVIFPIFRDKASFESFKKVFDSTL